MKLYYTKRSPYARKVRIVALEKNISINLVEEDLNNKSQELLKHNPLGKIPTLVLDDSRVLADSTLICEYLDTINQNPPLIADDLKEKQFIIHLDTIAKGMIDVAVATFYEILKHPDDFNSQFIDKQKTVLSRCLRYFEGHVYQVKDLNMASISLACALGYVHFRLSDLWPDKSCPELMEWFDQFSLRPSMVKTVPTV